MWRYLAQNVLTGAFVDTDVPLSGVALTRRLSGPWGMSATIAPEVARLIGDDGGRLLDEWRVQLWAELDGVIRGGGILTSSNPTPESWALTCEGHVRYLYGLPYLDHYSRTNVDPLDAARELWRHAQSYADGDLGVTLGGESSPVRLGKPAVPAYMQYSFSGPLVPDGEAVWQDEGDVDKSKIEAPAKSKLDADVDDAATSLTMRDTNLSGIALPFYVKIGSEVVKVRDRAGKVLTVTRGWDYKDNEGKPGNASAHSKGSDVEYAGTRRRKIDRVPAEPYLLAWWDAPDCGDEFDTLAKETPFDYLEAHEWADDGTIRHRIRLGYPSLGRRRDDLAFVEGENLAVAPDEERDGETFAQYVVGLGAGEGRKRRRTRAIGERDGRVRRPYILDRPDVRSEDRLARLAGHEQRARSRLGSVPEVVVFDHPNAPLGSWELGDEVRVVLREGWQNVDVWCRIVEETIAPENPEAAVLKLTRADGL